MTNRRFTTIGQLGLLTLLILYGLQGSADAANKVLTVNSERGATIRLLLTGDASNARANLILLAGGDGRVLISGEGKIGWHRGNFLVRSRALFATKGFLAAVMDAPSDRKKEPGLLGGFRISPEHADDLARAAAALGALNGKPVIVVGTSRGTVSAAHFAARHKPGTLHAAILTSSLVRRNRKGTWIQQVPLRQIAIPVLFVHNSHDRCRFTLLNDIKPIVARMKQAGVKTDLIVVASKKKAVANDCQGKTPHGYLGIEAQVVSKIAQWIKDKL